MINSGVKLEEINSKFQGLLQKSYSFFPFQTSFLYSEIFFPWIFSSATEFSMIMIIYNYLSRKNPFLKPQKQELSARYQLDIWYLIQ